jgi:hypothetical protein
MSTITLFTEMHTANHVSEYVLQCISRYPVHSALNVGLKLLQWVCVCEWFEYTVSLRCSHKKKSEGLKSGDRGGHNLFVMRRPGNTDSK